MEGASDEGRGAQVLSGIRSPVRRVRSAGRGRSTDFGPQLGPRCVVVCGDGGRVLLPVSYYQEVVRMSRGYCTGTEAGEPGAGLRVLAAGYPRLGWPGCPGVLWGRRLPTSAGCETTTCFSVTEVLRVLPQELTRRGDCGLGQARGMTTKRKWGTRMCLAVGTFPRPG